VKAQVFLLKAYIKFQGILQHRFHSGTTPDNLEHNALLKEDYQTTANM